MKQSSAAYFLFPKAGKLKKNMAQVPYNKVLVNIASLSHTGTYWPSAFFVFAWSVLPRLRANIPQYGPRARLVRG